MANYHQLSMPFSLGVRISCNCCLIEKLLEQCFTWNSRQAHWSLSCSDRGFWKSSFSASARSSNSHYSKILPVGAKQSPDSHVSNSPAQGNIRSLFICLLQRGVHLAHETFPTCKHVLYLTWGHLSNWICIIFRESVVLFLNEDLTFT